MKAVLVDEDQMDEWNALCLREPNFSLMQSWEWGNFKEQMGWQACRIAVEEKGTYIAGVQMLIKSLPLRLIQIAYIPRGPIGYWMDDEIYSLLFEKVDEVARSHHAVFLKIEPAIPQGHPVEKVLQNHQFRRSHHAVQPLATIVMDIGMDKEQILQGMRKSTRRKIVTAERKGVKVCQGGPEHLDAFYKMMEITARRGGFVPKTFDYYKNEWQMFDQCHRAGFFLAYFEDVLLAAHIVYAYGDHAAFFHQVSSGEYANLNANCLLVWEDIQWAKRLNCCSFDLWGIPNDVGDADTDDEDSAAERTDGLWGVYKFKRGFSKNIVSFAGSFDRVYNPVVYGVMMNDWVNENTIERVQFWMDQRL